MDDSPKPSLISFLSYCWFIFITLLYLLFSSKFIVKINLKVRVKCKASRLFLYLAKLCRHIRFSNS